MKIFLGIIIMFLTGTMALGTDIIIRTEGKIIKASLNESKTTEEFLSLLPLKIHMNNWDDREFYGKLQRKFSAEEKMLETYSNGDVTYYPRGNSLAIFYDKEKISKQSGLIKMGEITSDLSIFKELPENIEVYIERE